MRLNIHNNFKEADLGSDFARNVLKDFKDLISDSVSFVSISLPGVGVSYFLKYLSTTDLAYFIHVDLYELPNLSQHEFYKETLKATLERSFLSSSAYKLLLTKSDDQLLFEIKKNIKHLAETEEKIVIIFNRFDQLKKEFDFNFLSNLQTLVNLAPGKIVLIFTSIKPLYEVSPEAVSGGNLNFYSKELYFKPYSTNDLKKLLALEPIKLNPNIDLDKLIELSGGHNQLLRILLNSHKQQNLLLDKFVTLQLKDLVSYLDYSQRKQVQKVAKGHPELDSGSIDEYLLGVGMIKKEGSSYQLFTPLLSEYIKTNLPVKLPVKEAKLFKLLRNNMGKVVSKDEIFATVWEEAEGASDWALDALIYRLRKHPFLTSHGYIIESNKKVGYILIKI